MSVTSGSDLILVNALNHLHLSLFNYLQNFKVC